MRNGFAFLGCVFALGLAPALADQVVTDDVNDVVIEGNQTGGFVNVVENLTVRALFYSNSRNLADPYKITRAGGHCNINGSATDLQTALGLATYGFGCQVANNNAVADDFVLCDQATIEQIAFYLYQSGVTSPSINRIDYAILTTDPTGQPQPTWTTVNNPPVAFTSVYKKRDIDAPTAECTRRIQKVTVTLSPAVTLPAGRYWLAWRAAGTGASGPWQPPVVFPGLTKKPGSNALQSSGGAAFAPVLDGTYPQDLIFELYGSYPGSPTGACCLLTGDCVPDASECECDLGLAGTWQGVGSVCDPNPCVVAPGACCFLDGSCDLWYPADCLALYGVYMGPYTDCYPNPCPPPCVDCPPGAIIEGEPACYAGFVDTFNGGCNSTPAVFSSIACGQTVCGTGGDYISGSGGQARDTDWYQTVTTQPEAFTWTATATFPVLIFVIDGNNDCPTGGPTIIASATAAACQPATITTDVLPAGTYWFWVGTQTYAGVPCDSPYVATLTCQGADGACCLGTICQIMAQADCTAQGGVWQGAGTVCFPSPCLPPVDFYFDPTGNQGGNGYEDLWYYYGNFNWWNMWWPNEFALDRHKLIHVTIDVWFPQAGGVTITLNWDTPAWTQQGFARPPLPADVPTPDLENLYIGRQILETITSSMVPPYPQFGHFEFQYELPFCPDWVSMDVMGNGYQVQGTIVHVCLPAGNGACCLPGSICQVVSSQQCAAMGGTFKGAGTTCNPNPCICVGDLNCDGVVNFGDINPFVMFLSNFPLWQQTNPGCPPQNGDINGDGTYGTGSFADINPFVALIVQSPIVCQY